MDVLEACKANLRSYEQSGWDNEFVKSSDYELSASSEESAAVLIPLFLKNDTVHVLLTRRSDNLRTHKGQISFPGGKRETTDSSYIETALRETQEEIGIRPEDVEVISTWQTRFIRRTLPIYPVIGILRPGFKVTAHDAEVAEVFDVPLEHFLCDKKHRDFCFNFGEASEFWVHNYQYDNAEQTMYFIWGFTGKLCLQVAVIALKKLPTFELKCKNEEKAFKGFVMNKPMKLQTNSKI